MIPITAEQIAERDKWEKLLMDGTISLFDALYMMLATGAPATPYLLDRLTQVDVAYKAGEFSDMAEALGCALSASEKRAMERRTLRRGVKYMVQDEADNGYPLLNPNQHPDVESAFTRVAGMMSKRTKDGQDTQPMYSVSTVYDIYYDRDAEGKKEKRRLSDIKKK